MKANDRRSLRFVLAATVLVGASGPANAQSPKLRPIDQGVGDTGPLSASQRLVPGDLRVPSAFDRVYRIGPAKGEGGVFARINGGITAVFSRSQYVATRDGYIAETPAGTVYYIGRLPGSVTDQAPAPFDPQRPAYDDRSARRTPNERPRSSAVGVAQAPPENSAQQRWARRDPQTPTLFNDNAYRERRIGELLDQAAANVPR